MAAHLTAEVMVRNLDANHITGRGIEYGVVVVACR